ncbi:MAG TPA: ABC transporter permease [Nitrososphaerales archaeon]|nr:ABC transporter permease [Nitrososphaerales archaeon]
MKLEYLYGVLPIAVILVVWQLLPQLGIVPQQFLPKVSSVFYEIYTSALLGQGRYQLGANYLFTIERTLLGFALAAIIAVPLGIVIGSSRSVNRILEPTLEVFRPLPPVVLIPFFILIFGINDSMYVAYIAFGAVWPILINTIDGVREIEPLYLDLAKCLMMNKVRSFFRIRLPATSPYIVSGMRVSLLLALLVTVAIEMVTGHNGLGFSVVYAQEESDATTLYSVIVLLAITGYVFDLLFVQAENRFMKWYKLSQNLT